MKDIVHKTIILSVVLHWSYTALTPRVSKKTDWDFLNTRCNEGQLSLREIIK
jgi:hypothetical protein